MRTFLSARMRKKESHTTIEEREHYKENINPITIGCYANAVGNVNGFSVI